MRSTVAPILTALLIPVQAMAQTADRAVEFPDVAGYHTLAVDLHLHTVFSDGSVWPDIRVQEAVRDGLDAIAVTDHIEYQPHEADIPHPDRNRSHALALEYARGSELLVIRGAEVTRDMPPGHSNAVFLQDVNALNVDDFREAFRAAGEQDAFVFWNHPMWEAQVPSGMPTLTDVHRELIGEGLLHGIEVVNMHSYSDEALRIALDHDLTILGTSDIHGLVDWEFEVPEGGHRPVTLVFASDRTRFSLREALFAGRTVVWFDDQLIGKEEHLRPLLEASVHVASAAYDEETSILVMEVMNDSDAGLILRNVSEHPLHERADVFTLPAHRAATFQVKLPERVDRVALSLEVLNAVTAPDTHPVIVLEASGLR